MLYCIAGIETTEEATWLTYWEVILGVAVMVWTVFVHLTPLLLLVRRCNGGGATGGGLLPIHRHAAGGAAHHRGPDYALAVQQHA